MNLNLWHSRWINMATFVSSEFSKARKRRVGAVIVDDRNVMVSMGWNGPPRGVDDDDERNHSGHPDKERRTEHAERNAIYNAAAQGNSTLNCRIYQNMYPCSACARAIIQCGIKHIITVEPDWDDEKYKDDFRVTRDLFEETNMQVTFVKGEHPKYQKFVKASKSSLRYRFSNWVENNAIKFIKWLRSSK